MRQSTPTTPVGFSVPLPAGVYKVAVRMAGADCPDPFTVPVPADTWMSTYVACQG